MQDYAYQLYSSRNFPPLAPTLEMLAEAGYAHVEGFAGVYQEGAAAALRQAGLTMPSGHFSLELLENEPQKALDIAGSFEMRAAYCPYIGLDQRPASARDWRDFGARVEAAGEPLRAAGLRFGWHNHDFEFAVVDDGVSPMDALLEGGPSLEWEVDVAWILRAGADPAAWMKRYARRISAIHVKDIAAAGTCEDEDGWADVGHGVAGWAELFSAAAETDAQLYIMEHDNPSDHARFARRSIEAARAFEGG